LAALQCRPPVATAAAVATGGRGFLCACVALAACGLHAEEGGVYNGSFAKTAADGRGPDGWKAEGDGNVVQELTAERDHERGHAARLHCTRFAQGTPASHAMIAQSGHVAVRGGRWYRVSLWARASELEAGVVQVGLANSRIWAAAGLLDSFLPGDQWQRFEFVFRAERDVKAADSRLAIYFLSTGTLWLSDVAIKETTEPVRRWLPAIPGEGVTNALPNSSFEGGEAWGCSAGRGADWTADVFRRVGQWDDSQAVHGSRSWKVTLSPDHPLMLYGGYTQLAAAVPSLELGHAGWVRVQPGQPYVFSVYVKSDQSDMSVGIGLKEPEDWRRSKQRAADIGRQWKRIEVSYTPQGEFLRGYLTFGLAEDKKQPRTLWLDAAQFERGTAASPFHPRAELEAGIETGVTGNLFTDPAAGLRFRLRAYNDAKESKPLRGRLCVTDFWDRTVWEEKPDLVVAPGQAAERAYAVLAGRRGFFRIHWQPEGGLEQTLRAAVIEPSGEPDAIFGFNHAFGQDFVLPLAHQAGLRWWRDWSTKWETVQPQRGAPFDFHWPDLQINRVLERQGRMVVLLPYPSATWSAAVPPAVTRFLDERRAKGGLDPESARQAVISSKPQRLEDFAAYVKAVVKHFRGRTSYYEILNEPLYTHYALPSYGHGYKLADYLDVLRTAYQAAKAADPKCTVIGGIAYEPGRDLQQQFIAQGGLDCCDATNYHLYPTRQRPEAVEKAFQARWEQMEKRGQAKPIWVTEFGLYAEDDPVSLPARFGDPAMQNAMRPDERTAAADLVQWAAVMFAHGVRKIFYHAGICQGFHESSMGNMFFEYGGTPRKMYPAVAALARLLGPDFQFVRKWTEPAWLTAYEFRSRGRAVVILWTRKADAPKLALPPGFQALDLMGNALEGKDVLPTAVPLYLVGE
jgi:hypothetical protein